MDMVNCKKSGFVKKVTTDRNKIIALLKSAQRKEEASNSLPLSFIDSKITLLYDSLRILLEVLALKNSLKIYNHECYTAFLKEIINESRLGDEFDKFRKLRNALNYYGKEINVKEAQAVLIRMKNFIKRIRELNWNFFKKLLWTTYNQYTKRLKMWATLQIII